MLGEDIKSDACIRNSLYNLFSKIWMPEKEGGTIKYIIPYQYHVPSLENLILVSYTYYLL